MRKRQTIWDEATQGDMTRNLYVATFNHQPLDLEGSGEALLLEILLDIRTHLIQESCKHEGPCGCNEI